MSDSDATIELEDLADRLDLLLSRGTERWPQFLGVSTCSSYADVSEKTINRWIDAGLIVPCKVRGRVLIPRAEIDSAILACREARR